MSTFARRAQAALSDKAVEDHVYGALANYTANPEPVRHTERRGLSDIGDDIAADAMRARTRARHPAIAQQAREAQLASEIDSMPIIDEPGVVRLCSHDVRMALEQSDAWQAALRRQQAPQHQA